MQKRIIVFISILLIFLIGSCPVAAYFVAAEEHANNGNKPTVIVEYGKGKDIGLVKVTHIHYAKSDLKGKKPPTTDTCYKLAGWKWAVPVKYTIAQDESEIFNAVTLADSEWEKYTSRDLFANPEPGFATWGEQDYKNSVSYGQYKTDGVIAVTMTWYSRATRTAVESDILFDTDFTWGDATGATTPSDVMDLQNIATHEIGHTLGLSDLYTSSCDLVTMYGYSTEGDITKRDLALPDITGLRKIYGS